MRLILPDGDGIFVTAPMYFTTVPSSVTLKSGDNDGVQLRHVALKHDVSDGGTIVLVRDLLPADAKRCIVSLMSFNPDLTTLRRTKDAIYCSAVGDVNDQDIADEKYLVDTRLPDEY